MNVRKTILGFVAPAMLAGMAPVAQGIQWPIQYDPQFDGTTIVDLAPACLAGSGTVDVATIPGCRLDLVPGVDIFPVPAGTPHYKDVSGITNYFDIATHVQIDGGVFTGFRTRPFDDIILIEGGVCDTYPCSAALLEFQIGGSDNPTFPGVATLTAGTYSCDGDVCGFSPGTQGALISFYRVPEPGTLGLLFMALGFGWLTKRRTVST